MRSIADLTKTIELKPDYAEAYFNRGAAYSAMKDKDNAIADFKKADALGYPNAEKALRKLGAEP